jgi:exodeoxyribonuclease-3
MPVVSVLTWNVLFGGQDRFDRILEVLGAARPDVVVLQECLGWEEGGRLTDVCVALGLPRDPRHVHLGLARPRPSGSRYHVALFSRLPILAAQDHADPAVVGHCLVEATLEAPGGPITLLGTHLDAHGEDRRLLEARYVVERLRPAALAGARALLLGDLNALTPRDPYPPELPLRLEAARIDKYGHPPRMEVLSLLAAAGWVDLLARSRPERLQPGQPHPRWVTAVRGGGLVHARTDYVLASALLADRLVDAAVLDCGGASDHEPVVARLDL